MLRQTGAQDTSRKDSKEDSIHNEVSIRAKLDNDRLLGTERESYMGLLLESECTSCLLQLTLLSWKEDLLKQQEEVLKLNEFNRLYEVMLCPAKKEIEEYKAKIEKNTIHLVTVPFPLNIEQNLEQQLEGLKLDELNSHYKSQIEVHKKSMEELDNTIKKNNEELKKVEAIISSSSSNFEKSKNTLDRLMPKNNMFTGQFTV